MLSIQNKRSMEETMDEFLTLLDRHPECWATLLLILGPQEPPPEAQDSQPQTDE